MNMFKYLALAKHVSTWSKDPSTQVGAVLVRPDRSIASLGFNGFPRGIKDSPELLNDRTEKYKRIVHAEINAILQCRDPSVAGYTLYTSFMPCERCAVQVIQAGITEVVTVEDSNPRWVESFNMTRGLFNEAGVTLITLPEECV